MAIWQNKQELNVVDKKIQRTGMGTVGGDHVTPGSLQGHAVTGVIDDSNPAIAYGSIVAGVSNVLNWTVNDIMASGDTYTIVGGSAGTGTANDAAQLKFIGTTIGVLASTTPDSGKMQIYIDGVLTAGQLGATAKLHPPSSIGPSSPAVAATDTSIVLIGGGVGSFPISGTVKIGSELITYSGITGVTLTGCTRGTGGTTAAAHYTYETVYAWGNTIDLGTTTGLIGHKKLVYYNNTLDPGQHTITIVTQTGANGNARFYFDGFVVGGLVGSANIFTQTDTVTMTGTTDGNGFVSIGGIVPSTGDVTFLTIIGYTCPEYLANTALKFPILGMTYDGGNIPSFFIANGTPGTSYTLRVTFLYFGQSL